ncbi:MAG: hypothetical protein EOO39_13385, partial [Cytophagaceae bacterium]
MGTTFVVTLYASDSLTAQRTYEAVSARMDTLNQIMSDYLDGSELNRLSETSGQGRWVRVSSTLFDVLQKAKLIARQSGGRYDPTIGPLSQLWRRAVRQRQFPDARGRRKARRAVSWRYIELDSSAQSVKLRKPGMRLDLGGIGQGFAIDEAQKVLHQHNIRVFLLDIGGDKVVLGLSGGVDSTVAAVLLNKAIGKQLYCIFVNNGLLRKNEFQWVFVPF